MSFTVRVWDLPTRIFHWTLAACVIGLISTAQIGGAAMAWHFRFGYGVLCLLLFRLVWGIAGGRWSRFASFVYSPAIILRYVKGQGLPEHAIGHNPLGAGSVFAMLGFLLTQVATGLISDDEIAAAGPFSRYVSSSIVRNATFYHRNIGKYILIGLVLLHLGAICFYFYKKHENLLRPMIWGDKECIIDVQSSRDDAGSRTLALAILLGCLSLVLWLIDWAAQAAGN